MKNRQSAGEGQEAGEELDRLLAKAPPPPAPPWFVTRTVARLRQEVQEDRKTVSAWMRWRWVWAAGAAAVMAGWVLWNKAESPDKISDAMVFAALDALVEQEEENRWWTGL